jgi:hypothetical protein
VKKLARQGSDEASAERRMTIKEIQDDHPDFFYYPRTMMMSNTINARNCVLISRFEFSVRMYLPHFIAVKLPRTTPIIDGKSHIQGTCSYSP